MYNVVLYKLNLKKLQDTKDSREKKLQERLD